MKKVPLRSAGLLLFISFLSLPMFALATSGACSYHGGVNCAAGAGVYGQVICNDGWNGSSVSYASMEECQASQPTASADSLFNLKQQCASYTSVLQDEVAREDLSSQQNAKVHPGNSIGTILGEVFYSPVVHSCLYTETSYVKMASSVYGGITLPARDYVHYSINNYLDNESQIYAADVDATDTNSSKVTDFYNTVDYYKGTQPTDTTQPSNPPPPTQSHTSASIPTVKKNPINSSTAQPAVLSGITINASPATTAMVTSQPAQESLIGRLYHFFLHILGF